MAPRLVAYFPLADPCVPAGLLDIYADEGVDTVELGWPASDPYLDGPDVRASMLRAIGGSAVQALAAVHERLYQRSRAPDKLIMTYAERAHPLLKDAAIFEGIDATLVLAPAGNETKEEIERAAKGRGARIASFLPLPMREAEIEQAKDAEYYVMLQAAEGTTGPRAAIDPNNVDRVSYLRSNSVTAPIVLGFGISNGEQARAAVDFGANGVVVGSAVLRAALQGRRELSVLFQDLREGLDG